MAATSQTELLDRLEYSPLRHPTSQIRLLHLSSFRTTPDGPLQPRGTLTVHSRDESPKYIALSYTWGDADDTVPLILDGKCKWITRNLASFLDQRVNTHKSSYDEDVPFWIDALCIDQGNNDEKSQQVQNMGKIFSQAHQVIVWLGPASGDSDLAVEFLHKVVEHEIEMAKLEMEGVDLSSEILDFIRPLLSVIREDYDGTVRAVLALLCRPWWTRAWIQQEIALAPYHNTIVVCGDATITLQSLALAYSSLTLVAVQAAEVRDFPHLHQLEQYMNDWDADLNTIVLQLNLVYDHFDLRATTDEVRTYLITLPARLAASAMMTRGEARLEATLSVDLIYSVLGICKDHEAALESIGIDYDEPTGEVFVRTAKYLFQMYGVRMLGLCTRTTLDSVLKLPSWVPDWTTASNLVPMSWGSSKDLHKAIFVDSLYDACGVKRYFPQQIAGREMIVHGTRVDDLMDSGMAPTAFWNLEVVTTRAWLLEYKAFLESKLEAREIHTLAEDAIWRVPIADRTHGLEAGGSARVTTCMRGPFEYLMRELSRGCGSYPVKGAADYLLQARNITKSRQPFVSRQRYIGLGPITMRPGDEIFIIKGHCVPVALRRSDEGKYRIIGEVYVYGIMDGEFMKSDPPMETITLI